MSYQRSELRAYYEAEAKRRLRRPLGAWRARVRHEFCGLLQRERRHSVLDFGSGPGRDGQGFVDAGFDVVGIDVAHANALLGAEAGLRLVQASIDAPPIRPTSFDAGWSMSTLMHLPEPEVPAALSAMTIPLRAGAPLLVGQWGGPRRDEFGDSELDGHRRLFSMRPAALNRELLATCGQIEHEELHDFGPDRWEYQLFLVRLG